MTNSQCYSMPGCRIDHTYIISTVAEICDLPVEMVYKRTNARKVTECRGMVMYFFRRLLNYTYVQTGLSFKIDHSTATYWEKKVITLAGVDPVYRHKFTTACHRLGISEKRTELFLRQG